MRQKTEKLLPILRSLVALLCVTAFAACDNGSANTAGADKKKDGEEVLPVPVEVISPFRGDVFAMYSGTASLETEEEALIVAKVGGEVTELLVEEGDRVKEGDILARLDGDRLRLEMQRAYANLKKLQQEYDRNVELHDKGLVSAGAFEGIKYELESLKAAYNLARLEYSYTDIRAPIDGVITERFIKVGNTISANDKAFQITDMDPLLSYLFVPEKEFRRLKPGQSARMTVDAIPGEVFDASILRISPVVDPETGTFKVTLAIVDPSTRLKPGMFGRFQIIFDQRQNVLLVPRVAILEDETQQSVFVVEDGVAKRRTIQTGYSMGENIEVTGGLSGDETVITLGQTGLKDGAEVTVIAAQPTSG
jgi:membrane fusion protein (multidrug efflux system)